MLRRSSLDMDAWIELAGYWSAFGLRAQLRNHVREKEDCCERVSCVGLTAFTVTLVLATVWVVILVNPRRETTLELKPQPSVTCIIKVTYRANGVTTMDSADCMDLIVVSHPLPHWHANCSLS